MEQLNLFTMQKELTQELNEASRTYYSEDKEIMSDKEYDAKYDQLQGLEKQSGVVLPDSPTKRVGFEVVSKLKKVKHEYPALSLDKTKDRDALKDWLGHQEGCLSWKCDGLTIVLTYIDGRLQQAVTRGNGEIGEDVTHNAVHIKGIPREIPFIGKLIVRGETLTTADFVKLSTLIK